MCENNKRIKPLIPARTLGGWGKHCSNGGKSK